MLELITLPPIPITAVDMVVDSPAHDSLAKMSENAESHQLVFKCLKIMPPNHNTNLDLLPTPFWPA